MNDTDVIPERALLYALLDRAIRDSLAATGDVPDHISFEVGGWFASNGRKPFSFRWICEHLSLDHERVRAALERLKQDPEAVKRHMKPDAGNVVQRFVDASDDCFYVTHAGTPQAAVIPEYI
jgi:hypothetical protein